MRHCTLLHFSLVGINQGRLTMDIMANGRRSWRLIGALAIILAWGMAQGFQQAYGESFTELPSDSTKK